VLAQAPYLQNWPPSSCSARPEPRSRLHVQDAGLRHVRTGDSLLRFFAVYYAAVSLITFVVQTSCSRLSLEKLGLAATTSTPSMALMAGSIGGLLAPGLEA